MATLETLRRAVGTKTRMDYGNATTDRDLIDSWINEGVVEVLRRTHCFVRCIDLTMTADQWKYDLPSSIIAVKAVWRDGETDPMMRVSPEELIEYRRANGAATDATTLRWALAGANLFMLWPTPSSAIEINMLYVPMATAMTATSHDPSNATYGGIPTEYHKGIELWALINASDHEHEGRTQSGMRYLQEFEQYIARINSAVNRKGGRMPAVRIGRRPTVPSSNSVYPRY